MLLYVVSVIWFSRVVIFIFGVLDVFCTKIGITGGWALTSCQCYIKKNIIIIKIKKLF